MTCAKLDGTIRLFTCKVVYNYFQQHRSQFSYDITCRLVAVLCCQLCCKSCSKSLHQGCQDNLAGSLILLSSCPKLVNNLGQAVRTQLVNGLLTDFLMVVRFLYDICVCIQPYIYLSITLYWFSLTLLQCLTAYLFFAGPCVLLPPPPPPYYHQ